MLNETFEEAIEKAKLSVIKSYDCKGSVERKWLEANLDSYEEKHSRLKILVREGSPPKGHIIVNYGHQTVTAFDALGKKLYTWRYLREGEKTDR